MRENVFKSDGGGTYRRYSVGKGLNVKSIVTVNSNRDSRSTYTVLLWVLQSGI